MKSTAPRISDKAATFYYTVFSSLNAGLEFTADAFPTLYKRALHEIKGKFSVSELMFVVDVHDGNAMTPGNFGQAVYGSCVDGIDLYGLDVKWEIARDNLIRKIESLTSFQAAALEMWANAFWAKEAGDGQNIAEYVSGLAKQD